MSKGIGVCIGLTKGGRREGKGGGRGGERAKTISVIASLCVPWFMPTSCWLLLESFFDGSLLLCSDAPVDEPLCMGMKSCFMGTCCCALLKLTNMLCMGTHRRPRQRWVFGVSGCQLLWAPPWSMLYDVGNMLLSSENLAAAAAIFAVFSHDAAWPLNGSNVQLSNNNLF